MRIKYLILLIWLKKTDYDSKVTEIENKLNNHNHDKYVTTTEFNTLAADIFNARLSRANLVAKTVFDNSISSINNKIAANKTKNESIENEFKKLKTFDLGYFIGKIYFEEDGAQNHLVFKPIIRYFKVATIISVADYILSWQSKGLSAETIKPRNTSDNSLTPTISYYYASKIRVKFTGSCLKQPKISYTLGKVVNI